jgi:hypothetical protein
MPRPSFLLAILALGACGGTVVPSESGGTTSGAGGATTSTSTSTTTVGANSASASASSSGASASASSGASSSSSSGAGGGCGTLTMSEDGGPAQVFTRNCAGTMWDQELVTAVGWYSANPAQKYALGLEIVACKSNATGAEGLLLQLDLAMMQPMSYTVGSAQLVTGQGQTWTSESGKAVFPVDVTVTTSDEAEIVGTFSVTVVDTTQTQHTLTGEFDVCHPPDFLPP